MALALENHVTAGWALVPEALQKTRLLGMIAALYLAPLNELEAVFWELATKTTIDDASGYRLERLGKIVGAMPAGAGTDLFRRIIRCTVLANRSQGKEPELYEICRLFYNATDASGFRIRDFYPAAFEVTVDTLLFSYAVRLARLLRRAKPNSVGFLLIASEGDATTTFQTAAAAATTDQDVNTGLDWTDGYGVGGRLAFALNGSF